MNREAHQDRPRPTAIDRAEAKRAYDRAYHAARSPEKKDRKVALQRDRRQGIYEAVAAMKAGRSCACGENHPACLDFHHIDDDKEICIGNAAGRAWSVARIKAEIAKCVLVCANCHRKLHAGSSPAALTTSRSTRTTAA